MMYLNRFKRIFKVRPVLSLFIILNLILLLSVYYYWLKEVQNTETFPRSENGHAIPKLALKQTRSVDSARADGVPLDGIIPARRGRYFEIDYTNDQFVKDGKPFRYVAGSLHYFRVPRAYWRDRLHKMRAAGLNAVSTYVEWSSHEPYRGVYNFTYDLDLEYFLELAQQEDLLVLLRPGPYICAERDLGGLPPWLLNIDPNMKLRTSDQTYQREVQKWFDKLFKRIKKYLYGNGGNIIMVQVENEYGSYFACDLNHTTWLRDLIRSYVDDAAVLYTTDGGSSFFLRCGAIPNVYATVDFGSKADANASFTAMRSYQPRGPLVNSEFYPGWLSHWEENLATVNTSQITNMMEKMLLLNASFNFYMFHGGTNFGFMAGANADKSTAFAPQLTSYDYDAPLDEAGDPTSKYYAIKETLSKYFEMPNIPVPVPAPKGNYGRISLQPVLSLFDTSVNPDAKFRTSTYPLTFEELNQKYGFVLYETVIPENLPDPSFLHISNPRDRVIVYVNKVAVGILSRSRGIDTLPLIAPPGHVLSILVENQGRINYGEQLKDFKGLLSPPTLNNRLLHQWNITGFPFDNIAWIHNVAPSGSFVSPPAFYTGKFFLPQAMKSPLDTYIDPSGWGKGVIFINDINLGRYWPSTGPQVTLYVPGCYLKPYPEVNTVVLFELEYTSPDLKVQFVTAPILNITPPLLSV